MRRRVLHLVRQGATPHSALVAERDWVVYLKSSPELAVRGDPPFPAGPIDHAQLVTLSFAADLVITW